MLARQYSVPIYIGTCCIAYSVNLFDRTFVQNLLPAPNTHHQILVMPMIFAAAAGSLMSAYLFDRLRH